MAHRATSVPARRFTDLLAAPFAALGEALSAVIAANSAGRVSR
jgi:hypothetical protein